MLPGRSWFLPAILFHVAATLASSRANAQEPAKKPTAEEVARLWSPELKSAREFSLIGASPKMSPGVAAYSFRVVGPTFGDLWSHYAKLCGVKQQYEERTYLTTGDTGPNGSFVVTDRAKPDDKGGRLLSVFLLKTEGYTASVTLHPDADGKSISGSLSVIVP